MGEGGPSTSTPTRYYLVKTFHTMNNSIRCTVLIFQRRHVLLHISYAGWNLHGFALQEITGKTVESELFKASLRFMYGA